MSRINVENLKKLVKPKGPKISTNPLSHILSIKLARVFEFLIIQ
jgi:hypothetical protein